MSESSAQIRRGWTEAAAHAAPSVDGLQRLIDSSLAAAEDADDLSEARLLGTIEAATSLVAEQGTPGQARELGRHMRRTIYEYLLAVDAASDDASVEAQKGVPLTAPMALPTPRSHALIGAEEVEALRGDPAPAGPLADDVDEAISDEPKRRFGLFRRDRGHADSPEEAFMLGTSRDEIEVMPKAGFHLGNPIDLVEQSPETPEGGNDPPPMAEITTPSVVPQQVPAEAASAPAAWGLRDSPPDGNRVPQTLDPHEESFSEQGIDLTEAKRQIDDRLRRKKCDEAAALLQQLAQEVGGRVIAELALDAGDRCRALGKRLAATNCYLAASRSDPVYDAPLARLADICIDDQDIDLAISYLERVARLTRLRGDVRGALRIYRKIVTIAPYREDVLELLMRAQTTGRLDP